MNLETFNVWIKTKVRRWLSSKLRFEHPTSYPYISGDGFRAFAQHAHDEFSVCEPTRVRAGDVVFTRTYFLDEFIMNVDAYITEPYILITHNDDYAPSTEAIQKIRAHGKAQHWFMQNAPIVNEFITPLPIGLQNYLHTTVGIVADYASEAHGALKNRERHILGYSFSTVGNPTERSEARACALMHPHSKDISSKIQKEYIHRVSTCSHIVSPPGRGEDCLRTWEALYVGAIPIVKKTPLTDYFVDCGLPIKQVASWTEIASIDTKADYIAFAPAIQKSQDRTSPLWMPFWTGRIIQMSEALRAQNDKLL